MTDMKLHTIENVKPKVEIEDDDLAALRIDKERRPTRKQSSGRSAKSKSLIALIVSAVLLTIGILAAVGSWKYFRSPVEVEVTTAVPFSDQVNRVVLSAGGYIVAERKAVVTSRGGGRLIALNVQEGDRVKKGQIIARLEDDDLLAGLKVAEAELVLNQAQLESAENSFSRHKALIKAEATSYAALESTKARYQEVLASIELARARIESVKISLNDRVIRAPIDGTVIAKSIHLGEMVTPAAAAGESPTSVVTIADLTSLQVEVDVSESHIDKIRLGQACEILLDAYPDRPYKGKVLQIVPTSDRTKATILTKIGLINCDNRVLPEMSAKALFLNEEKRTVSK